MAQGSIRRNDRKGKDGKPYSTYTARIDAGTNASGKRIQPSETFRTKTEAQTWRTEQLAKLASGQRLIGAEMTVAELFARWLPLHEREVRGNTARSDRWGADVILPVLGHVRVQDVGPLDMQAFYDGLDGRFKPGSIQTLHRVVCAAFDQAVAWEIIDRNPAKRTKRPKPPKGQPKGWTADEAQRFLAATRDDFDGPLFATLLWTGMRISEATALDWRHVDLETGWLAIERTMTKTADGVIVMGDEPKTPSSRRRVPLAVPLQAALKRQRDRQDERRRQAGEAWRECGAIFDTGDGTRRTDSAARHRFYRLVDRLGLMRLNPHGCRHTAATLLIKRGVPPHKVKEILGHSSVAITMDLYVHMREDDLESVARAFEDVLGGEITGQRARIVHVDGEDEEITASGSGRE